MIMNLSREDLSKAVENMVWRLLASDSSNLKMFDGTIKMFEMCDVKKMEVNIQVVTGLDECKAMNGGRSRQRLNGPTVIGNPVSKVFLDKEV